MKDLYVECEADKRLVLCLGKNDPIHVHGKGEILRKMAKRADCVGLIDEDPGKTQPSRLNEYKIMGEYPNQGIRVLHNTKTHNTLIVICPRLEEWILEACKESGVCPKKYGLPEDPKKFHEIVNVALNQFEKLIVEILKSQRLKMLKNLLVLELA